MRKILILTESYPSKEKIYNQAFIHSRSIEYLKQGVSVDVLSFSSDKEYFFDGVNVYTAEHYFELNEYDAIVSHAPNIRHHYRFIKKHKSKLNSLVLFFHGHEILKIHNYYPDDYPWLKPTPYLKKIIRNFYDAFKLKLVKNMLNEHGVRAVFVSQWMYEEGLKCLGIESLPEDKFKIINNPINSAFSHDRYCFDRENKQADFITIRPLDGKKYAVDKVVELAKVNPKLSFHIYGKGLFFNYVEKPRNVEVFDSFIEQKNIPQLLNKYKAAIMPTRLDAQGVMMCEMASYGIPIIVSDLPVCHEMLDGFKNVTFIKNENFDKTEVLDSFFNPITDFSMVSKFDPTYLAANELEFIFKGHQK